jgi:hypothetical protein
MDEGGVGADLVHGQEKQSRILYGGGGRGGEGDF